MLYKIDSKESKTYILEKFGSCHRFCSLQALSHLLSALGQISFKTAQFHATFSSHDRSSSFCHGHYRQHIGLGKFSVISVSAKNKHLTLMLFYGDNLIMQAVYTLA